MADLPLAALALSGYAQTLLWLVGWGVVVTAGALLLIPSRVPRG